MHSSLLSLRSLALVKAASFVPPCNNQTNEELDSVSIFDLSSSTRVASRTSSPRRSSKKRRLTLSEELEKHVLFAELHSHLKSFSFYFYFTLHVLSLSLLLSVVSFDAVPTVKPHDHQTYQEPGFPLRCYPDPCKGVTFKDPTAICGDPRLGPRDIAGHSSIINVLETYTRFGDLCPFEFLEKWTVNASDPDSFWIYPGNNGFATDHEDNPVMESITLRVGQRLDRFGRETGNFLTEFGAPYHERALPPSNLFAPPNSNVPHNYYVYEVIREFDVLSGPIAAWFEQPGLGTQILTELSVSSLLNDGFLRRLEVHEYAEVADEDFADDLP